MIVIVPGEDKRGVKTDRHPGIRVLKVAGTALATAPMASKEPTIRSTTTATLALILA